MRYSAVLLLTILPANTALSAEAAPDVPAAIRRGLTFIVADGLAWKKERNCVSCHHAALGVWAMQEAKARGHAVDEAVLTEFTNWIAAGGDGKGRGSKPPPAAPKAMNMYAMFMALGLGADPRPHADVTKTLAGLRNNSRVDQLDNGSWMAWPETRPPIFDTSSVAMTALATIAQSPVAGAADDTDMKAARAKALKWLDAAPLEDDLQGAALRLIVARRAGHSTSAAKTLVERILATQKPDGGWAQAKDMASDAHATGQALWALAASGRNADDPAVKRGQLVLAKTQRPDGSWEMTSRPCPPSNKGAKLLQPIGGAGAAWGVMGLVRSTPVVAKAAAQDADPLAKTPSHFAKIDGHKVHYKSIGEGKTAVVFVHGWSCDMTFWKEQVPALAGKTRVVLVDLPGHGKSDKPKIDYTIELFARGVEAVLQDAGVEKAILAGHSMGTPVVRQYSRLYPKKTQALIAVDGALRNFVKDPAVIDKIAKQYSEGDFKANMAKFVDRMFTKETPAALKDHIRERMQSAEPHVAASAMRNMFDPKVWQDDKIVVPLQVISAKGPFANDDYKAYVLTLNPDTDWRVMSDVGHFLMLENPRTFNEHLLAFLKKQGALRASD
jgi:pimeloyl-ACP methyl ester carboxylesterase